MAIRITDLTLRAVFPEGNCFEYRIPLVNASEFVIEEIPPEPFPIPPAIYYPRSSSYEFKLWGILPPPTPPATSSGVVVTLGQPPFPATDTEKLRLIREELTKPRLNRAKLEEILNA